MDTCTCGFDGPTGPVKHHKERCPVWRSRPKPAPKPAKYPCVCGFQGSHRTMDRHRRHCDAWMTRDKTLIDAVRRGLAQPKVSGPPKLARTPLNTHRPQLLAFWHPQRNSVDPGRIGSQSLQILWWLCPKCGHEWSGAPKDQSKGVLICPACIAHAADSGDDRAQRLLTRMTFEPALSLATLYPQIASEWHPTRNTDVRNKWGPASYRPTSHKRVWWLCPNGHEWSCQIQSRIPWEKTRAGQERATWRARRWAEPMLCPHCPKPWKIGGKLVVTVADTYLKDEWDTKTNGIPASSMSAIRQRKAWWICNMGHSWQAAPYTRYKEGAVCPHCTRIHVLGEDHGPFFIYRITNQLNGKVYIGQSRDPIGRWRSHIRAGMNKRGLHWAYAIQSAIRKYGAANFRFEILGSYNSTYEVDQAEVLAICEHDSMNPTKGYNLSRGGGGVTHAHRRTRRFTFEECRQWAIDHGVKSAVDWVKRRQLGMDPKCPGMPHHFYRSEWRGWPYFTGKFTYEECRDYARTLSLSWNGNMGFNEWRRLYRSGNLDPRAPYQLKATYPKEWVGWREFVGATPWFTYEEFRRYVHSIGVKTHAEWRAKARAGLLDPRAPVCPYSPYRNEWQHWGMLWRELVGGLGLFLDRAEAFVLEHPGSTTQQIATAIGQKVECTYSTLHRLAKRRRTISHVRGRGRREGKWWPKLLSIDEAIRGDERVQEVVDSSPNCLRTPSALGPHEVL